MACNLIEDYEGNPAFLFIRDMGMDWSESHVIDGETEDYIVVARKERNSGNWFIGALTAMKIQEMFT